MNAGIACTEFFLVFPVGIEISEKGCLLSYHWLLTIYIHVYAEFFVFMNIQSCHVLIASSTFSCNWMKVHQSVNLVKISAYICINKQLLVFQKVVLYLFSNFQKLIRILPFQWWIKNIQKNYSDRGHAKQAFSFWQLSQILNVFRIAGFAFLYMLFAWNKETLPKLG